MPYLIKTVLIATLKELGFLTFCCAERCPYANEDEGRFATSPYRCAAFPARNVVQTGVVAACKQGRKYPKILSLKVASSVRFYRMNITIPLCYSINFPINIQFPLFVFFNFFRSRKKINYFSYFIAFWRIRYYDGVADIHIIEPPYFCSFDTPIYISIFTIIETKIYQTSIISTFFITFVFLYFYMFNHCNCFNLFFFYFSLRDF